MFKPKITAKGANAVGNYALQIQFSDGHATGIYSFEHLREICPCERCTSEFRPMNRARCGEGQFLIDTVTIRNRRTQQNEGRFNF